MEKKEENLGLKPFLFVRLVVRQQTSCQVDPYTSILVVCVSNQNPRLRNKTKKKITSSTSTSYNFPLNFRQRGRGTGERWFSGSTRCRVGSVHNDVLASRNLGVTGDGTLRRPSRSVAPRVTLRDPYQHS